MALTVNYQTIIVAGLDQGRQDIVETIPMDTDNYRTTYISTNGEYFFQVYHNNTIEVYRSCFFTNSTYYYGSDGECLFCDSSIDMFV